MTNISLEKEGEIDKDHLYAELNTAGYDIKNVRNLEGSFVYTTETNNVATSEEITGIMALMIAEPIIE